MMVVYSVQRLVSCTLTHEGAVESLAMGEKMVVKKR